MFAQTWPTRKKGIYSFLFPQKHFFICYFWIFLSSIARWYHISNFNTFLKKILYLPTLRFGSNRLFNYLAFQSFDFTHNWWRLFQKSIVHATLDIYNLFSVFITSDFIEYYFLLIYSFSILFVIKQKRIIKWKKMALNAEILPDFTIHKDSNLYRHLDLLAPKDFWNIWLQFFWLWRKIKLL